MVVANLLARVEPTHYPATKMLDSHPRSGRGACGYVLDGRVIGRNTQTDFDSMPYAEAEKAGTQAMGAWVTDAKFVLQQCSTLRLRTTHRRYGWEGRTTANGTCAGLVQTPHRCLDPRHRSD